MTPKLVIKGNERYINRMYNHLESRTSKHEKKDENGEVRL